MAGTKRRKSAGKAAQPAPAETKPDIVTQKTVQTTDDELNSDTEHSTSDLPLSQRLNQLLNTTNSAELVQSTAQLYNTQGSGKVYTDGFTNEQVWLQMQKHSSKKMQQLSNNLKLLQSLHGTSDRQPTRSSSKQPTSDTDHSASDAELDDDIDEKHSDADVDIEAASDDIGHPAAEQSDSEQRSHSGSESDVQHSSDHHNGNNGSDDDAIDFEMLKKGQLKRTAAEPESDAEEQFTDDDSDYAPTGDDGFYSVRDMNTFADQDAENVDEAESSDVDLDADVEEFDMNKLSSDKYSTFFDAPDSPRGKRDKRRNNDDDSEVDEVGASDDDEFAEFVQLRDDIRDAELNDTLDHTADETEPAPSSNAAVDTSTMSAFERQQHKINRQILDIEQQLVAGKEWDTIGEVDITKRPADSLLQKHVEFDYIGRIDEPITQSVNERIEQLVKQRIIAQQFDDVVKPVDIHSKSAQRVEPALNDSKSQLSLAQVYEQEYVEQRNEEQGVKSAAQLKLEQKYADIDLLFAKLNYKLDSLTNFHYTPKPAVAELTVSSSKPAITMEEVTPLTMNTNSLQTAAEAYTSKRHNALPAAQSELTQAERKRRRAHKKERYAKKHHSIEAERAARQRVADKLSGSTDKTSRQQVVDALSAKNVKHVAGSSGQAQSGYSKSNKVFDKLQRGNKKAKTAEQPSVVPTDGERRSASSVML